MRTKRSVESGSKTVIIYNENKMEVLERSVFALTDYHKSVTRRLIRGSIRVRLARYESNDQCETMVQCFPRFPFRGMNPVNGAVPD